MIQNRQDTWLKLSCPRCYHEHVSIGIHVDRLIANICPSCGGYCNISSMKLAEFTEWLRYKYIPEGDEKNAMSRQQNTCRACNS